MASMGRASGADNSPASSTRRPSLSQGSDLAPWASCAATASRLAVVSTWTWWVARSACTVAAGSATWTAWVTARTQWPQVILGIWKVSMLVGAIW